jgi:hypothetical protein
LTGDPAPRDDACPLLWYIFFLFVLYASALASCIIAPHLIVVICASEAVGGLYLFPLLMAEVATVVGVLAVVVGAWVVHRRPGMTGRLALASAAYALGLIVLTLVVERIRLRRLMLPFVFATLWDIIRDEPASVLYGPFFRDQDSVIGQLVIVALGIAATSPLLLVLLLSRRRPSRV